MELSIELLELLSTEEQTTSERSQKIAEKHGVELDDKLVRRVRSRLKGLQQYKKAVSKITLTNKRTFEYVWKRCD